MTDAAQTGPSVPSPARVAVLVSGGGSNLQALIERFNHATDPVARVELVVASRPGVGALERARAAGIPTHVQEDGEKEGTAAGLLGALGAHEIDLVVLAGYLRLVPAAVVERFRGRMINVHPALLPAFGGTGMYGARVHQAVVRAGVRVSGVTVHLVDERYDTGEILAQWPVPVLPGDTAEALAARVLAVEHRLLPLVVEALARDEVPGPPAADPVAFDLESRPAPAEGHARSLLVIPGGLA